MIRLIQPAEVDYVWPMIAEGMERACEKAGSSYSNLDFYRMCRTGAAFLHIVTQEGIVGAVVTEPGMSRRGPFIKAVAMCGEDMERWIPDLVALDLWKGARFARFEGRRGLQDKVPGAKVIRQVYELELPHAG